MFHTLLISLALVGGVAAVVALCIFVARQHAQRKNKKLQDTYQALLLQHNVQPEFSQVFKHRIFALDTTRRLIVFVQDDEAQPSAVLELSDIGDCRLWKEGVQISRKKGMLTASVEEYISAVGLSFVRKSGEAMNIPFYTEVLDGIEEKTILSKAADHWLQRIKDALAGIGNPRSLTPAM